MEKISRSRVIVFGVGGVGSFVVEALVRSGIASIDIVDDDRVVLSNLNRQLYALHSTLGHINPECSVTTHKGVFMPQTADLFDFTLYDYVVDCIDTVTGKLEIIMRAKAAGVPVISCMGAGNKVDPTQFHVADISRTSVCPLARVMRRELQKRGIKRLKCLYSTEKIIPPEKDENDVDEVNENEASSQEDQSGNARSKSSFKKQTPGSNAFVPSVAGLIIAGEVLKDLTSFHVTNLFPPVKNKAK